MKAAFYFSHDVNAKNDEKILQLRCEFGWEGYGIYWAIIEALAEATEYKLKLNSINALALGLAIDKQMLSKCLSKMFEIELLAKDNIYFYSKSLLKRMELKEQIREKRKEAGKKGGLQKHINKEVIANAKQMPSKCLANALAKPSNKKEIKRKVNKKENEKENEKENIYWDIGEKIIDELNKIGNRSFRYSDNNLKHILARLGEGFTFEDCIQVIETKKRDIYFINNPKYFNPETLFRPSNFEKYLNELESPTKEIKEKDMQFIASIEKINEWKNPLTGEPMQ